MKDNISKLLECLAKTGVCQTGRRYLNSTGKDFETLIKVWRGWPEYWYEHSEPTIKTMRQLLTKEDKQALAKEFLFVDFEGEVTLNNHTTAPIFVVGNSNVIFNAPHYKVAKLYLFNEAKVVFNIPENSILNIEMFDSSQLHVNNQTGKCTVYKYDQSTVSGHACIIEKEYIRGEIFNGKEIQ